MADLAVKLTIGGDVQAQGGTYLTRPADEQLFQACLAGEFAYVLACRQIGKSSLKNAVAERLIAQGMRVARIDLNSIGSEIKEAEKWYFSLLYELARRLNLKTDAEKWWESQPRHSTLTQRFLSFFNEVVLVEISEPVVIFIDEIDVTLGMPFTDNFFAGIRVIYNDRAQNPAYRRLTFVLLGVATPDELISDNNRTPFNIGRAITMRDFTPEECVPLRSAIETKYPPEPSQIYFQQIYEWTGGHPYLTQKLCEELAHTPQTDGPIQVDNLVKTIFLTERERLEDNIKFVQVRVLGDPHAPQMLQIYKQILQGKSLLDDEKSLPINRLKLYGLVVVENGRLKPRNKIYTRVFDLNWTQEHIPFRVPYRQITFALVPVTIILLVLTAFLSYQSYLSDQAETYRIQAFGAYGKGNYEQAIVDYTKAVELYPDNLLFKSVGLYPSSLSYSSRGNTYRAVGNYEQALADHNQAIELEPNNEIFYLERGDTYYIMGDYERAFADYAKAIELDSGNSGFYVHRGDQYLHGQNYEQAIADYTKAIELDQENQALYVSRGDVYRLTKNYVNAISDYTKAIELQPDDWARYLGRGDVFREAENYENAIADYTKANELNPNDGWLLIIRGDTYRKAGNPERAIEDFTKLITLNPDDARYYLDRGAVYREAGDLERAIADYTRVIELQPDSGTPYLARGDVFRDAENYDQALADYTKAIELNPDPMQ